MLAQFPLVQLNRNSLTLLVVSNLCELERNGAGTQVLGGVDSVTNRVLECTSVLACGLAVCNANNQNRLARLTKLGQNNTIDDLLAQFGAERCKTLISPVGHDLSNLLLGADVSKHVRRGAVIVHEADLNAAFAVSNVILS